MPRDEGLLSGGFRRSGVYSESELEAMAKRGRETDRKERADLLSTSDIKKKIQFNPEYINIIEKFFEQSGSDRVVLLHSVRGAGNDEPEYITRYVKEKEKKNIIVYIPKKFNFQEDNTGGVLICNTMRYAISKADRIAIGYNPDSEGTKVDYGIVLYNRLPVIVLNSQEDIKNDQVYNWMRGFNDKKDIGEFQSFLQKALNKTCISQKISVKLEYMPRPDKNGKPQPPALTPFSAVELGIIYASQNPFSISNLDEVKAQADLEDRLGYFKSYSKVALKLHGVYNK